MIEEEKLAAIESYRHTQTSISTMKVLLCKAAIIAIASSVMLACMIAGALVGIAVTRWSDVL